jgi:hypothetical protein
MGVHRWAAGPTCINLNIYTPTTPPTHTHNNTPTKTQGGRGAAGGIGERGDRVGRDGLRQVDAGKKNV